MDKQILKQIILALSDEETRKREVSALTKLPKLLECERRTIITYDEETTIEDEFGIIDVMPAWKWLLEIRRYKTNPPS